MKYSRKNKRVKKTRSKTHKMRGGSPRDEGYNSPSSPQTLTRNSRKRNSNPPRSAKKAKK
jgi:hypothetical protein